MTSNKLAAAAAAASLTGVAMLSLAAPALAQQYPPATGAGAAVSDSTPVPGQTVTVSTGPGSFDAGSTVTVSVPAFGISRSIVAAADGSASFTFEVPEGARPGAVQAVFSGTLDGAAVTRAVTFTVVAAAAPARGRVGTDRTGGLPFTGADDLVPMAITGTALVGVGAAIVVAARRKAATDLPSDLV